MEKQEIFNKVYLGLKSQGFQQSKISLDGSTSTDTMCQYRGDNGLKCAIGWLIPDEKYEPSLEHGSIKYNRKIRGVLESIGIGEQYVEFLNDLQVIHDASFDSVSMQKQLDQYADRHKLSIPQDDDPEQDLERIIDTIDTYDQFL